MADRSEFDGFVAARSPRLLRTAYLLTRDWALAGDLLQTALARSWFAWGRLDADRRALRPQGARQHLGGETPTDEHPERAGPDPMHAVGERDALGGAGPAAAAAARRAWFADGPGWTFDLQHDAAR